MNLSEIKEAVTQGETVCWSNERYKVVEDSIGRWLIVCDNGSTIGLTHKDGVTMNGEEKDFYIPCKHKAK